MRDAVFEFKKGIKRDSSSFLVYKDEKQWDTWQRSTLALARAQDVHEVLDASYVPVSSEDKQLFAMKQEFMYAVFERTLQTDMGKTFVRRHEADFDAQTIYVSLVEYSIQSTKASLDTSKILAYITSARLGDGGWTGKLETFILQWQDKLRLYDKLVQDTERFPASIKRVMLENAVHPIAELRAVKNQADQLKTTSGTALTYEEYCRLVLSAAASYDNELLPRGRQAGAPPSTRRSVYTHEVDGHEEPDAAYDIDTDIDVIRAPMSLISSVPPAHGCLFPAGKAYLRTRSRFGILFRIRIRLSFLVLAPLLHCVGFVCMTLLTMPPRLTMLPILWMLPRWILARVPMAILLLTFPCRSIRVRPSVPGRSLWDPTYLPRTFAKSCLQLNAMSRVHLRLRTLPSMVRLIDW
jgi:hypothetical protein